MFATSKMIIKKADPWTQIPSGLSSRSVGRDVGIPNSREVWRSQLPRKDIEYGDSSRIRRHSESPCRNNPSKEKSRQAHEGVVNKHIPPPEPKLLEVFPKRPPPVLPVVPPPPNGDDVDDPKPR